LCLPIHYSEEFTEQSKHQASALELELERTRGMTSKMTAQLLDKLVHNVGVHDSEQDEKGSGNRSSNDPTNMRELIEPLRDRLCRGCNDKASDDNNPMLISNGLRCTGADLR
jgi:hypothetical protein